MKFELPPLPFAYDAMEPYMDKETLHFHHDKHHQAYVDKLNKALEGAPGNVHEMNLEQLLRNIETLPSNVRTGVRNNGGGHYNHLFFWDSLMAKAPKNPEGEIANALNAKFGSFEKFRTEFSAIALNHFASGWAWLCLNKEGQLTALSIRDQDCPISQGLEPLLTLDLWEHAYYLKYQNRRAEFIEAFWNIVNWPEVNRRYTDVRKKLKLSA